MPPESARAQRRDGEHRGRGDQQGERDQGRSTAGRMPPRLGVVRRITHRGRRRLGARTRSGRRRRLGCGSRRWRGHRPRWRRDGPWRRCRRRRGRGRRRRWWFRRGCGRWRGCEGGFGRRRGLGGRRRLRGGLRRGRCRARAAVAVAGDRHRVVAVRADGGVRAGVGDRRVDRGPAEDPGQCQQREYPYDEGGSGPLGSMHDGDHRSCCARVRGTGQGLPRTEDVRGRVV